MSVPVFIHAYSLANALGGDRAAIARGLMAGDTGGMAAAPRWRKADRACWVGEIGGDLPAPESGADDSRCHRILLKATLPLLATLRAGLEGIRPDRIAVVMGTSTSGIDRTERAMLAAAPGAIAADYDYAAQEFGSPASFLAGLVGATGPCLALSTACTSSTRAFVTARRLLRLGLADAVLAGGCDSLCRTTVEGFSSLEATSPVLTNPFSRNRRGINIGEAAGVFLLRREEGPFALVGAGETCDAHHLSAPEPSGRGAEGALRAALADAGLAPEAIAYVNLHGTGTAKNDEMEAHMMGRVFPGGVPCSSTKPMTGHTLGAAGATEVGFCLMALEAGLAPPHRWDGEQDTALPRLDLAGTARPIAGRTVMTNNFAFGGDNVSLVLRRT